MEFGPRAKRVAGPCWDLARVKELVSAGRVYLMRRSAYEPVRNTLGLDDPHEIAQLVAGVIELLEEHNYAHSLGQRPTMDVYGIIAQGHGWYVKLYIDEDVDGGETTVCSFHPPRADLVTKSVRIPAAAQPTGSRER